MSRDASNCARRDFTFETLPVRASLTNGEISRRLGSQSFRELATDFDEVVYGLDR